ncbi:MAG: C45 family autoproteolytic acyltransferase/hydrolase [Myxococcota bacterium]
MATFPRIRVDLNAPSPWQPLAEFAGPASRLLDCYLKDLGDTEDWRSIVELYRNTLLTPEEARAVDGIAKAVGRDANDVLLANLYYDAFRALIGCTAVAVESPDGPLHARNLDWWTEQNLLASETLITDVVGAPAGPFSTIGWPGLYAVYSGVAPGRFAITLNAVVSTESPTITRSTTLFLREVFATARTYEEAVERLTFEPIAADCLLLVTGVEKGQRVVIERTSTRAELRDNDFGPLVVTNDYRAMEDVGASDAGELYASACGRFDRATYLASIAEPTPEALFDVLRDRKVKMEITVQQMVLCARTGLIDVRRVG